MARGINKVILVGNLGNDPDVRYTANGAAVSNISVATSESWKDKGNRRATGTNRMAPGGILWQVGGNRCRVPEKGSQVYVEGRLQTRKWQDKDGNDRYTTEIVANEMQMLGSRAGGGSYDQSSPPPANKPDDNFVDDDIPF